MPVNPEKRVEILKREIRLHTPVCGECRFDCRAIDATLFSGQVAILLQCTNGHLTIKYVSPERYFEN